MHVAENRKVLITTGVYNSHRLLLYDIERKQWFAVHLENDMLNNAKIQAISNASSVMFVQHNTHRTFKICKVDLADGTIQRTDIVCNNDESEYFGSGKLLLGDGECYATWNRTFRNDTERRYRFGKSRGYTTELFVGHILPTGNDNKTILTPLLSFKENGHMDIVANEAKLLAVDGGKRTCIYIYDLKDCHMTKLALKTDYSETLAGFRDGFVVYNDSRIVRIVHVRNNQDTFVKQQFEVFETKLRYGNASIVKYIPLRTMWIRYPQHLVNLNESHIEFTHADLGIVNPDEANWTSVEWPRERGLKQKIEAIQEMAVPKNVLKCNIKCPHCDRLKHKLSPHKFTPIRNSYRRTYGARFFYDSDNDYNYDSDNLFNYDDYYYDSD